MIVNNVVGIGFRVVYFVVGGDFCFYGFESGRGVNIFNIVVIGY